MVSFSCEKCGDVLTKKKLDPHRSQCRGASFTCLDCMIHFQGTEYRSHTSCISEAQKYQGALYKEKNPKSQQQKQTNTNSQALVPRKAYVEDAPDPDTGVVAIVDAPPHAPSPPPADHYGGQAALPSVNVFDFLVDAETPNASKLSLPQPDESHMIEDNREQEREQENPSVDMVRMEYEKRHYYQEDFSDHDYHYVENGFGYGDEPVPPSSERYDSYANVRTQEPSFNDSAYYTTPAPKPTREERNTQARENDATTTVSKKSDKKRKRQHVEEIDMALVRAQAERDVMMTDAPPVLHSGLTGGLNRLLSRADFPPSPDYSGGDYIEQSPLSPVKRAKQSVSKALARVQREQELEEQRERERELKEQLKEQRERERGRDREPKSRKAITAGPITKGGKETNGKVRTPRTREEPGRSREFRRRRRRSSSTPSLDHGRRPMKAIEYHRNDSTSPAPNGNGALILRNGNSNGTEVANHSSSAARAELFMSFINKGPESERGMSVNKALKRYHRERYDRWERVLGKGEEEKELWKGLRLRRNERGEVVLFF
ncbi:hypothetical protein K432DRAFT_382224 [Lepidopterella palustris CBS 459.81]|uniref:Zinc finger C2H2 LYAR-type domain-containing protein n=1 Tax=Lepidopterella palustris CBS 459.81 TaxID=1314670 RepID=A0A8E2EAX3_9PEZI|nr:hypothetical protein K432DRAFT_382224 [Lepidopterella palustris CBS 459.81]